jgi:F0F1-type ATP synthase gamma subunit
MSLEAQSSDSGDYITAQDTIFEPSIDEIADLIEKTMMTLAFSQAILESSLAQNASRFNAMAVAKKRAYELLQYYKLEYHRAKRSEGDRRSREVVVSLKKKKKIRDHA